jgi:hypothetical protein
MRVGLVLVLVGFGTVGGAAAQQPAASPAPWPIAPRPGSAADARQAYDFFYSKLDGVTSTYSQRVLTAIDASVAVAMAGPGASQEATQSYDFFYAKLDGAYSTYRERVLAAIELAKYVATSGVPVPPLTVTALASRPGARQAATVTRKTLRQRFYERLLRHFLIYRTVEGFRA